jgi:hypothetical protein
MNIKRFTEYFDAPTDSTGGAGTATATAPDVAPQMPDGSTAITKPANATASDGAAAKFGTTGLPPADFRSHFNERGEFVNPDWAKAMGLPDGFASKFKTVDGALKSYANLEKSLGSSNKVTIPSENASKEEVALFRSKLGVPEKATDYKIEKPAGLPDELWGAERVTAYQNKAHELGLSAKQASELAKWQADQLGDDYATNSKALEARRDSAVAELKKDWGNNYDANLALAERGAAAAGISADVLKTNPELSNNPHFIKAMQAVALKLGEDRHAAAIRSTAGGLAINSPEAAQAEISKIRGDKNHAYNNPSASPRDREAAVAYVAKLYALKNPDEAA